MKSDCIKKFQILGDYFCFIEEALTKRCVILSLTVRLTCQRQLE